MLSIHKCAVTRIVPTNLPAQVVALDFTAIKQKMLDPLEGCDLSAEQINFAELEYRKFLALRVWYPSAELVPNKLIDEIWHAHILDTLAYVHDCESIFGEYLHHYPYMGIGSPEAREELEDAFEKTKALYETHFGQYPAGDMAAARCEGHKCHAPSPCSCRSPGACKNHTGTTASVSHFSA